MAWNKKHPAPHMKYSGLKICKPKSRSNYYFARNTKKKGRQAGRQ